jgi:probable HAF family extracellular repeat protein
VRPFRLVLLAVMLALAGLAATAAPAATTTYSITDLGSLGFGVTDGLAINANGQVTGYSYSSTEFQISCPPKQYGQQKKCFEHEYHAFLWGNGTMTDLGTLGGHFSRGNAINLSGEVVGTADTKTGLSDGFLWDGKRMTDLGAFNPGGINDSGAISGTCGPNPGQHACLLVKGTVTQLPNPTTFTPIDCGAGTINKNGMVLGGCDDTSSYTHAVVWQNGTATDLGTLGGAQSTAGGLNNLGQVAGSSQTSTGASHAFLWSNGTMTDLGVSFFPAAINDNGVIVGGNDIYSNGVLQDLNTLIPAGSPYQIEYATAINDNGQIVAQAQDTATAQMHTLLLTPN